MKITIESTSKIVELNGEKCRVWEGVSENGIKVHAFITRIAADKNENLSQFQKELEECKPPSVEVEAIPFRLIV